MILLAKIFVALTILVFLMRKIQTRKDILKESKM